MIQRTTLFALLALVAVLLIIGRIYLAIRKRIETDKWIDKGWKR